MENPLISKIKSSRNFHRQIHAHVVYYKYEIWIDNGNGKEYYYQNGNGDIYDSNGGYIGNMNGWDGE